MYILVFCLQNVMGLDPQDEHANIDVFRKMNVFLEDRTTLAGTKISQADTMMFECLYKSLATLTYAEKEKFIHLSRWFSYLQSLSDVSSGSRPRIPFSKVQLYAL